MIPDGPRICYQCSTVFEFVGGLPVDVRWSSAPCTGCERWHEILELAKRKAAEKTQPEPEPAMDLSPAANLRRLQAGKPPKAERDWAMAAAGDEQ